jgi:hypothetical protein
MVSPDVKRVVSSPVESHVAMVELSELEVEDGAFGEGEGEVSDEVELEDEVLGVGVGAGEDVEGEGSGDAEGEGEAKGENGLPSELLFVPKNEESNTSDSSITKMNSMSSAASSLLRFLIMLHRGFFA